MTLSTGLAASVAVAVLGLATRISAARRRAPRLPAPAREPRSTAVLLPARNEEDHVGPCVRRLLGQSTRPRVILVDDGSTDSTVAAAQGAAAGSERFDVLEAGRLPAGWRGKVHALHRGLERALESSEPPAWILATDADTRHAPDLLARALAAAERFRLDAVSLAAHQEARGLGENLIGPPVFMILDGLLGDWNAAARSETPPVANGQYFLVRREALEAIGGFAAIRGVALDDVGLATALRAEGYRTGFLRAPDGLSTRMYEGFRATVDGWRRNLGWIFGPRPLRAAGLSAVLLGPPLLLAAALATGRWVETGLLWGAGAGASMTLRASAGNAPLWGLLHPLDALATAAVLALGILDYRRGEVAAWKGRAMRV